MNKFLGAVGILAAATAGVVGFSAPTYAEGITTCDDLQQAINAFDVDSYPMVSVHQNITCATDITIPGGKEVYLDLGTSFYMDSNGGVNFDNGKSIIVEEGATLRLMGSAVANTDNAVIKNYGKLYIVERWAPDEPTTDISNTNGGLAIINYGELNVGSDSTGVIISGNILNNDGTVRLAGGRYSDSDFAKEYIVNGCELEENVGELAYSDITCVGSQEIYSHGLADMFFLKTMPIGYSYSVTFEYPELAEARGYYIGSYPAFSSDYSSVSVTGTALNGFTISAIVPGESLIDFNFGNHGGSSYVRAYDVTLNGKSILPNDSLANQLIGQELYTMFDDENYELNAQLSAGVADPQFAYDDEDIAKALNGDEAIGLYDIAYIIYDASNNPLASVTDLNEPLEISLNIPVDLPELAEGYVRKFYVVRKHQDASTGEYQVDILPATVDGDQAKFKSDKFSTFVLAYADIEEEVDPADESEASQSGESKSEASTPDTGAATGGSQAISGVTILGSLIAGIAASFALFPRIRKIVTKK